MLCVLGDHHSHHTRSSITILACPERFCLKRFFVVLSGGIFYLQLLRVSAQQLFSQTFYSTLYNNFFDLMCFYCILICYVVFYYILY